jgi:hypothetical protein
MCLIFYEVGKKRLLDEFALHTTRQHQILYLENVTIVAGDTEPHGAIRPELVAGRCYF